MHWRVDREPETFLAALCNKTYDSYVTPYRSVTGFHPFALAGEFKEE